MFAEVQHHLEEDQLVPDDISPADILEIRVTPAISTRQRLGKGEISAPPRTVSDLWNDIEDIIHLEEDIKTNNTTQESDISKIKRPENLSVLTPDFAALINDESPKSAPSSPGFHEVPRNDKLKQNTNLRTAVNPSLMETSLLINNSLTSGCEFHRYDNINAYPPIEPPRVYTNNNNITHAGTELQRTMEMEFDPEGFMQIGSSGGGIIEDMKDRMKYAYKVLDIPMDPNTWTVEHVQRWATFVMKQYNSILDTDMFLRLSIDGAKLTTMTREDFGAYFPNIGEMLYSEMELWSFAFSCGHVMTTPMSNPVMPQAVPQEVTTYTDLDSCKMFTYETTHVASLPPMTSHLACPPQTQPTVLPPMYTLTNNSQIYVKQEPIESDPLCLPSPTASPETAHAPRIPSYSSTTSGSSSTSCGYLSSEDPFEDRDLKRHIMTSSRGKHTIQLWQFLKELLLQPQCYEAYIRWLDRCKGIFKIEDSAQVAKLWGRRKNRPAMNYDKLSRSIRQYYKKGIIKKTGQSKRLVYQFCPQYNG